MVSWAVAGGDLHGTPEVHHAFHLRLEDTRRRARLVGDELYCVSDSGVATCVDARTGAERWRRRLGGNYSASPLHANGIVYFQNEEGEAVLVKAGPEFEELARNQWGEGDRTFASYAVDAGSLILRSASAVYRIGGR